jgi:hypothetical protein
MTSPTPDVSTTSGVNRLAITFAKLANTVEDTAAALARFGAVYRQAVDDELRRRAEYRRCSRAAEAEQFAALRAAVRRGDVTSGPS